MADLTISEKNFNVSYYFKQTRQDIFNALEIINNISNDKYTKVAYIKIFEHLIIYTYHFEEVLLTQQIDSEKTLQEVLETKSNDYQQIKKIKSQLKTSFNEEVKLNTELIDKFNKLIQIIDERLISWITVDNQLLFNQYLINLIHPDTLSDFIWCNTFINIFGQQLSINKLVKSYKLLPQLSVEELYEMYLFISEFNINEVLLTDKKDKLPASEDIHKVFEYLYDIVENNINFVPKEQQHRLSFANVVDSYVSVDVPSKSRFVELIDKVNEMLTMIEENDSVKVLFTRAYPLFIEAFDQPSDKTQAIRYRLSTNFNNTKQYFELLQQTIH